MPGTQYTACSVSVSGAPHFPPLPPSQNNCWSGGQCTPKRVQYGAAKVSLPRHWYGTRPTTLPAPQTDFLINGAWGGPQGQTTAHTQPASTTCGFVSSIPSFRRLLHSCIQLLRSCGLGMRGSFRFGKGLTETWVMGYTTDSLLVGGWWPPTNWWAVIIVQPNTGDNCYDGCIHNLMVYQM